MTTITKIAGVAAQRDHRAAATAPNKTLRFKEVMASRVSPGIALDRGIRGGLISSMRAQFLLGGGAKDVSKLTLTERTSFLHRLTHCAKSREIFPAGNSRLLGKRLTPGRRRAGG